MIPELNCTDLYYTNNKFLPLLMCIKKAAFLPAGKILKVTKLNTPFLYLSGPCSIPALSGLFVEQPGYLPRYSQECSSGNHSTGEPSALRHLDSSRTHFQYVTTPLFPTDFKPEISSFNVGSNYVLLTSP